VEYFLGGDCGVVDGSVGWFEAGAFESFEEFAFEPHDFVR
jgi:hypothetical protein